MPMTLVEHGSPVLVFPGSFRVAEISEWVLLEDELIEVNAKTRFEVKIVEYPRDCLQKAVIECFESKGVGATAKQLKRGVEKCLSNMKEPGWESQKSFHILGINARTVSKFTNEMYSLVEHKSIVGECAVMSSNGIIKLQGKSGQVGFAFFVR